MYSVLRSLAGLGVLMLLNVNIAQAALVQFSLTGRIDGSTGAYGLDVGDTITAFGVFDDSAILMAPYTAYFDSAHGGNVMTVQAGSLTVSHTQDLSYASGGSPKLEFNSSGALIGVGFDAFLNGGGNFYSGTLAGFQFEDGSFNFATGYWDASSLTVVPIPAAVWLLGSGLIGLAGFAVRKRQAN